MPRAGKDLPKTRDLSRRYPSAAARLKHREVIKDKENERPWYDGGPGTPSLPGEPCRTPPHPDWSENEKWVWEKICIGEPADFNNKIGYGLIAHELASWTEDEKSKRRISARFLKTILCYSPWKETPRRRIRVDGCFIEESLNLIGQNIRSGLWIVRSRIQGDLLLDSMEIPASLVLCATWVEGKVDLMTTEIGGHLWIDYAVIEDKLVLERVQIGLSVFMRNGVFIHPIKMIFAKISGNVQIGNSTFSALSLRGTKISGELMLVFRKYRPPKWINGGALSLRNASIGQITDILTAWPNTIVFEGLTYKSLSGPTDDLAEVEQERHAKWYTNWIAKQTRYSPQPYEQCASVLREAGQPAKANAVLFAGKERERESLRKPGRWPGWRWLGQTFLKYTIGYGLGYRYFQSLICAGLLIFIGAVVFASSDANWPKSIQYCYAYSLDMVLPLIQLTKAHYDEVNINGWQRYYFYFHQLAGYVLASVVVAGLAGILRK